MNDIKKTKKEKSICIEEKPPRVVRVSLVVLQSLLISVALGLIMEGIAKNYSSITSFAENVDLIFNINSI